VGDLLKLDLPNYLLLLAAFVNLLLAAVIYFNSNKKTSESLYSFLALSCSMWALGMFMYRGIPNSYSALIWARFYYVATAIIPASLLIFVMSFPNKVDWFNKKVLATILIISLFFSILPIFPNTVVTKVVFNQGRENDIFFGSGFNLWGIYLFSFFVLSLLILVKRLLNSTGPIKKQYIYILFGSYISVIIGVITNHIFPFIFNNPNYAWIGPTATIIMVVIITAAILKQRLFNIRLIATQLFIFSLWIFLLVRAFISGSIIDQLVNWGSFIGTVVIGTFLIRSVLKEVSQREKIEKLAEDLGKANERLKELDKQKTEFVSIASHQLRSPLTAIKGYSSMLIEGSFGPIPKKAQGALEVVFQSSQKMISVIEDFLNITRIELGRMKYEMSDIDVGALAKQVVEEQRPQVTKNGLKLEFEDDGHDHNVYADMGKLNQVFNNIIDNAGKYTKEGWIRVRVENLTKPEGEEVVRFVVKDSGVGIPPETLPKLFEKFVRAYDAGKVNLIGTGLGLYVAKQIVEGLGGKIWAESEGKGKGSTFIVEFKHTKPLAEQEKEKKVVEFVEGI